MVSSPVVLMAAPNNKEVRDRLQSPEFMASLCNNLTPTIGGPRPTSGFDMKVS